MGELVKQLAEETSTLVRQELQLARAELTQQGKRAGLGVGELGGAGLVGLYALGALTACFIAALAIVLPVWASALIIAAVYGAIAGVLALIGRRQLQQNMPPKAPRTERTIQEDIEWVKTRKS
ncbi:MAG: phage holin family protein [Candidatus Dormibacteraeota bacterium]|nr:phage holin family protein [Candidatus Dormibacteraeota bacterium]